MKFLPPTKASSTISKAKKSGKIFSVLFIKRTDGEPRLMVCRGRVKPPDSKRPKPYRASDYGLSVVYDVQKRQFRSIPLDTVVQIKAGGKVILAGRKK